MHRGIRIAGRLLLIAAVAVLLAPTLVPPFLDRNYYRGPPSDHFDGQHFFNPDDRAKTGSRGGFSPARMVRFMAGRDRAPWPASVPVTPSRPPARVEGQAMLVTWIGHSTVLVQTDGLNILTDPIWSDRAGPWGMLGPRRVAAPGVRFEDLPKIDLVLVSHNHYDHMDLATLERLWRRDRPAIVTSLGNDTILRWHGIPSIARDWRKSIFLVDGKWVDVPPVLECAAPPSFCGYPEVRIERVHHWGSRWGRDRNRALWSGFRLRLPSGNIFFAGDTGWGDGGWVRDAATDEPYRLAIIPIGAFQPRAMMEESHIGPVEAVQVFKGLKASHALAVHWGTFQLSNEARMEPPALLAQALDQAGVEGGRFRALDIGQPWSVPPR